MNVGSLFAGIGGFDLAAERVGMTVEWQAENDQHAADVLAHHWPEVPNLGDVNHVKDAPGVDVLTGGFPCQDYSVAGTRGGLAGDRGALWWEYLRLIDSLRPAWVVGENVPGLLSSRDGADFETIVGSLTECGYGVAWAVLDAQYFGVAQRRRRLFIVGHSGGVPRPEVLALSEGLFGHPEPRREAGKGLTPDVAGSIDAGEWRGPNRNQIGTVIGFSGGSSDVAVGGKVAPSVTGRHGDQGAIAFRTNQLWNGAQVRRLTPLECERLQGFPDGWTDIPGNSDTQRYRQLGSAVAVPVVEWILRRLAHQEAE